MLRSSLRLYFFVTFLNFLIVLCFTVPPPRDSVNLLVAGSGIAVNLLSMSKYRCNRVIIFQIFFFSLWRLSFHQKSDMISLLFWETIPLGWLFSSNIYLNAFARMFKQRQLSLSWSWFASCPSPCPTSWSSRIVRLRFVCHRGVHHKLNDKPLSNAGWREGCPCIGTRGGGKCGGLSVVRFENSPNEFCKMILAHIPFGFVGFRCMMESSNNNQRLLLALPLNPLTAFDSCPTSPPCPAWASSAFTICMLTKWLNLWQYLVIVGGKFPLNCVWICMSWRFSKTKSACHVFRPCHTNFLYIWW